MLVSTVHSAFLPRHGFPEDQVNLVRCSCPFSAPRRLPLQVRSSKRLRVPVLHFPSRYFIRDHRSDSWRSTVSKASAVEYVMCHCEKLCKRRINQTRAGKHVYMGRVIPQCYRPPPSTLIYTAQKYLTCPVRST